MTLHAVTVLGLDRPGIISDVTSALASLGGNLEDSSMTLLRGHFAWMLIVDVDAEAADVSRRLDFLSDQGLVIAVLPVPDQGARNPGSAYLLTVHGADRPGIVSQLTSVLSGGGGNITDLTTRLGAGGMYVLVAEVDLPADVDVVSLGSNLAETARSLGVEASLRPGDPDLF